MRSLLGIVLIALVPCFGFGQTDDAGDAPGAPEVYEQFGISFACPPGWQNAPLREASDSLRAYKLFDVIRIALAPEIPGTDVTNRKAMYDSIQARAYLLAYEKSTIGFSDVQFTRQMSDEIRKQGYELVSSKTGRENNMSVIASTFRYRMPPSLGERDIWLSVRFFLTDKYIFVFYGSCRSDRDLPLITALFAAIKPIAID
jgi:hypothetical protein